MDKKSCSAFDDYYDAALALDLKTGKVEWSHKLQSFDTWTLACFSPAGTNPNCPVQDSPDFDLGGAGPNLLLATHCACTPPNHRRPESGFVFRSATQEPP